MFFLNGTSGPISGDDDETKEQSEVKKKDRWDKAGIILRFSGGLLTAIIITFFGFYGKSYLESRQIEETNLRLYSELMSQREKAENQLRTEMFSKIFDTFLKPEQSGTRNKIPNVVVISTDGKRVANPPTMEKPAGEAEQREAFLARIKREILSVELITRNFHEFVDIKPLFIHVLMEIVDEMKTLKGAGDESRCSKTDREYLRELANHLDKLKGIARRVIGKQREVLEEVGVAYPFTVEFDKVCTEKNILTLRPWDTCAKPCASCETTLSFSTSRNAINLQKRDFSIEVTNAYPDWDMVHLKITAKRRKPAENSSSNSTEDKEGKEDKEVREFWVGSFDFPLVDNAYLSAEERFAVVLDSFEYHTESSDQNPEARVDKTAANLTLLYFPASFAGLKEKSFYHQKVVQRLIEESRLFGGKDVD